MHHVTSLCTIYSCATKECCRKLDLAAFPSVFSECFRKFYLLKASGVKCSSFFQQTFHTPFLVSDLCFSSTQNTMREQVREVSLLSRNNLMAEVLWANVTKECQNAVCWVSGRKNKKYSSWKGCVYERWRGKLRHPDASNVVWRTKREIINACKKHVTSYTKPLPNTIE